VQGNNMIKKEKLHHQGFPNLDRKAVQVFSFA
jgi:hypothetical protein